MRRSINIYTTKLILWKLNQKVAQLILNRVHYVNLAWFVNCYKGKKELCLHTHKKIGEQSSCDRIISHLLNLNVVKKRKSAFDLQWTSSKVMRVESVTVCNPLTHHIFVNFTMKYLKRFWTGIVIVLVLVLNFESFCCDLLALVGLVNKNGCKGQHKDSD